MTDAEREDALQVVARRAVPGGTPRRTWPLTGGVSAGVTALEIATADGETVRLVLRRHGEVDRGRNPRVARDEFRVLEIARAHGLAVPRPVLLDESGELLATPFLVIEYVDGEPDLAPADLDDWVDQAVDHLTRIHAVPAAGLAFLPAQRIALDDGSGQTDRAMGEDAVRAALAAAGPPAGTARSSLLHGDYWPGNLLWRDGQVVAVIDWEDARTGDPLGDLANARLETLWAFGAGAMGTFTERYRAAAAVEISNWADLPYWDLIAALRPCGALSGWRLGAEAEDRMRRRHRWFVGRAIRALRRR